MQRRIYMGVLIWLQYRILCKIRFFKYVDAIDILDNKMKTLVVKAPPPFNLLAISKKGSKMEPLNQFSHVYTKTKTPKIKMSNIVSKREDSALGESLHWPPTQGLFLLES